MSEIRVWVEVYFLLKVERLPRVLATRWISKDQLLLFVAVIAIGGSNIATPAVAVRGYTPSRKLFQELTTSWGPKRLFHLCGIPSPAHNLVERLLSHGSNISRTGLKERDCL